MVTRRMILAVPVLGALASCAPSPVVTSGSSATTGTLAPDDPRYVAAAVETELAALTTALAGAATDPDAGLAPWCRGAAEAHAAHARVLLQADPLGGTGSDRSPVADPPSPSATATPAGSQSLARAYRDAAESHRAAALDEQDPSMRMLWCSLAVFAARGAACADASSFTPAPVAGRAVPVHVEAGTAPEAMAALVSRVDALRYGLETMIGRSGGGRDDMSARSDQADALRVELAGRITAAGGQVPGPELEYELDGDPDDAGARDGIWARLEDDLLAGWVRLAAATTGASGSPSPDSGPSAQSSADPYGLDEIIEQATQQAAQAPLHGLGTSTWPGWV
ncbi:Ferritin-like superfamily [Propionibacterium ruminifibrarum]|uniref:Ferritin-like superfamily n=1 Tax=Propionibacterium ruminifibrarum TaxID=1962131 RepID=A0A375HYX0_9ACTN|nr:hypothetical protein [Propionibacterium ruminifibrarum]SPF67760.1 Ferritin-like superfamily [Propionibacterium ruminifibrarum]